MEKQTPKMVIKATQAELLVLKTSLTLTTHQLKSCQRELAQANSDIDSLMLKLTAVLETLEE